MKVSIVGLGWYGAPLGEALRHSGYEVIGSTRNHEKKFTDINTYPFAYPELPPSALLNADILILNIPPFEEELEWFQKWVIDKKTWVIFISSTSESETLLKQEAWIKSNFKTWTVLRFAGLLGGERHPGKHLAGKKNLKGRLWPVNLLHLTDAVGFTQAVIEKKIEQEIITVVSDMHLTREKFYTNYAQESGLPLPEFDMEDETIKLAKDGTRAREIYKFKWPKDSEKVL